MIQIELEIAFSFKRDLPAEYRTLSLREGSSVLAALRELAALYPSVAERIFTAQGAVRRDVSVLVNGGNVMRRNGLVTLLASGDRLTLLPPVGGG